MSAWVSGWLAVGYMGDPIAGYARLAEGSLGQVIASFTLMLADGFGSSSYSPGLDAYPITLQQAYEMGWLSYAEDRDPPSLDHLWRPIDLSTE
jgi:hypothetical protein